MKLVVIESPYAGDVEENLRYLREAMRDCLYRNEAPYASHALYTQPGVLDDNDQAERQLGMIAGFLWGKRATKVVVYADKGITPGMYEGIKQAKGRGQPIEVRYLYGEQNATRSNSGE